MCLNMTSKRDSSCGVGTDPSPPAAKRQKTLDVAPSWADLRPELIGCVARFIDVGNSDLISLLLCVGSETAAIVRKTYLQDNDYFLRYCISFSDNEYFMRKEKILRWMEHNEDEWKQRCHGAKLDNNIDTVALRPDQAQELVFKLPSDLGLRFRHYISFLGSTMDDDASGLSSAPNKHLFPSNPSARSIPTLISVGRTNVGGMSVDEVDTLVADNSKLENGKVILKFMRYEDFLFSDPVTVIRLGLTKVLRYLVDEDLVGINDSFEPPLKTEARRTWWDWDDDEVPIPLNEEAPRSLLYWSLYAPNDFSCFNYLVSHPDVNVNAEFGPAEDHMRPIHVCICHDFIPLRCLEALLRHPNIDVNARAAGGFTGLHFACNTSKMYSKRLKCLKVLVRSGGNIFLQSDDGLTPIEMLRRLFQLAQTEERKIIQESRRFLQEASTEERKITQESISFLQEASTEERKIIQESISFLQEASTGPALNSA